MELSMEFPLYPAMNRREDVKSAETHMRQSVHKAFQEIIITGRLE
jgi:hypothetical protein